MKTTFLNDMTPGYFLKHYWNKRPYLFKGAVPEAKKLGTTREFTQMSLSPAYETRMVIESGGDYPWQAQMGPFKRSDFKNKSLRTLICHNLELYNEDFQKLKENINFIPDWHFDDIMATISNKGSSVGAHIDDYSVFIIQGKGRRRWLLQENPNKECFPDLDIKLLTHFNPEIEWILEPGDMIYIPPNVAHHGISLEDSISYSIGFKSVRYNQLIMSHAMDLMQDLEEQSFSDNHSTIAKDPFLITKEVSDTIYKEVTELFSDREKFNQSLIKFLSKPKNEPADEQYLEEKPILKILKNYGIKRDMWSKMTSLKTSPSRYQVSINQRIYALKAPEYIILRDYFDKSPFISFKIKPEHLKETTLKSIFIENFQEGVFYKSQE
ncbi:MAG: hypothetical protein NDI69_10790 [Bacteriovoracaceae bacterium]|nr:hypothetical protein [Bacteriovoracaceae bacterium]